VKLERKHAILFLAIAVWNVLSYANFARNLLETATSGEERAAGYYVAHVVLIVVNLAIAVVLGRLGWKAWRATSPSAARGSTQESARR